MRLKNIKNKSKAKFFAQGKAGFSLVELMVVIGILAILAAIAIPNLNAWLPVYRLKSAARDLYSNMQKAKLTAVKRNVNCAITFNQSIGGTNYDYVVYVDADSNCEYDAGEDVIVNVLLSSYKSVSFDTSQGGGNGLSFADNDDGNSSISFQPNAIPTDNNGGIANGTVFLINTKGGTRSVVVNLAGNISLRY